MSMSQTTTLLSTTRCAICARSRLLLQIHQGFDRLRAAPGREDACWYLQRSKKFGGRLEHEPGS